jgi:hypothetical protein
VKGKGGRRGSRVMFRYVGFCMQCLISFLGMAEDERRRGVVETRGREAETTVAGIELADSRLQLDVQKHAYLGLYC